MFFFLTLITVFLTSLPLVVSTSPSRLVLQRGWVSSYHSSISTTYHLDHQNQIKPCLNQWDVRSWMLSPSSSTSLTPLPLSSYCGPLFFKPRVSHPDQLTIPLFFVCFYYLFLVIIYFLRYLLWRLNYPPRRGWYCRFIYEQSTAILSL